MLKYRHIKHINMNSVSQPDTHTHTDTVCKTINTASFRPSWENQEDVDMHPPTICHLLERTSMMVNCAVIGGRRQQTGASKAFGIVPRWNKICAELQWAWWWNWFMGSQERPSTVLGQLGWWETLICFLPASFSLKSLVKEFKNRLKSKVSPLETLS